MSTQEKGEGRFELVTTVSLGMVYRQLSYHLEIWFNSTFFIFMNDPPTNPNLESNKWKRKSKSYNKIKSNSNMREKKDTQGFELCELVASIDVERGRKRERDRGKVILVYARLREELTWGAGFFFLFPPQIENHNDRKSVFIIFLFFKSHFLGVYPTPRFLFYLFRHAGGVD
jgi:hypothetical protein